MSATLGGLIKDYRLQKNLSQMEVAFALGWNETSRLSRIEQGKVGNPSREFIDRLIKIMKLEEEEKNTLLLAGNYLPTLEEIEQAKKIYESLIDNWPFPATVFDFSWRVMGANMKCAKVYPVPDKFKDLFRNLQVNRLEVLFDDDFVQNKFLRGSDLQNWHDFLTNLLAQYRSLQKNRTKENWYILLIKKMLSNKLFRTLWQRVQFTEEKGIIQNYGRKKVVHPDDRSKRLEFHVFLEPLMRDSRFYIDLQLPADETTFEYFKQKQ